MNKLKEQLTFAGFDYVRNVTLCEHDFTVALPTIIPGYSDYSHFIKEVKAQGS